MEYGITIHAQYQSALPDFKKTVHFLYQLLDVSWNIFTSHSTSTPSAFEVFFTANALYKLLTYLLTSWIASCYVHRL